MKAAPAGSSLRVTPVLRRMLPALILCCPLMGFAAPRARLDTLALSRDSDAATMRFSLTAPSSPRAFTLHHPERIVVDFPQATLASGLRAPAAAGPVSGVRVAPRSGGGARVVLQLKRAQPYRLVATSGARGSQQWQLRIGGKSGAIARTSDPEGKRSGNPAEDAASGPRDSGAEEARVVAAAHAPRTAGRDIIVAIDAGHGGTDPGASGANGTHEKDITLAIAERLARSINAEPGMSAVLTRDHDVFVPLRDRMQRARAAHADMLVSIHADAVRDRDVDGASVYILSERGASSEAARWLAEQENAADLRGGVSLADQKQELASVLLNLSQSATIGNSVEAADQVLKALDAVGAIRRREVQQAGFLVLKAPDMPSMLVETAYISNPGEERKLRSADYQQKLASAITRGVQGYFRQHPPDGTQSAAGRGTSSAPISLAQRMP